MGNIGNSYIDESAQIGSDVVIGKFCIIEAGVVLGEGVQLGDYVLVQEGADIGPRTQIGTYCKVGANAKIGADCSFTAYCEIRDHCDVGNKVLMGSRCTLSSRTIVGDDVIIKYGFVATDTPDLTHNDEKQVCVLKKGSLYGANVTIMPAVTVGEYSQIGASSQVRHDVPDRQIWFGCPAKYFKDAT
jgi:UDP-3-O-[3-hydroxymyristoyl] glucosamine N-acyltransferase